MVGKMKKTSKNKKKEIVKREIPEYKLKLVRDISDKIKEKRTFLIASTKGLPSSQFHEIKKNLRGKADIKVAKKSIVIRSIDSVARASLDKIKESVGADVALFFSDLDPFALSGLLADNQSNTKAKAGDIAPEDISVEPGPTSLVPGPAISELSSVGLKVAVEGGKLVIKLPKIIVKKGEEIKENAAGVMAKLDIKPMKVCFEPIAAYDREDDRVYVGIKIDKKKTYEELIDLIRKALGFAVSRGYVTKETISHFITRAGREEIAIEKLIKEEPKSEEKKKEIKKEVIKDEKTKEINNENKLEAPIKQKEISDNSESKDDNQKCKEDK